MTKRRDRCAATDRCLKTSNITIAGPSIGSIGRRSGSTTCASSPCVRNDAAPSSPMKLASSIHDANRLGESVKVFSPTIWWSVMSKRKGLEALFDGRHFDREIIILCVRWYLRYKLDRATLCERKLAARWWRPAHLRCPARSSESGNPDHSFRHSSSGPRRHDVFHQCVLEWRQHFVTPMNEEKGNRHLESGRLNDAQFAAFHVCAD